MKKYLICIYVSLVVLLTNAQSVAINTDGSPANNSSILDIKSSSKGILVPRMTTVQRNAIASPANGLLVYDTNSNSFWFYNGSTWTNISTGSGNGTLWSITGNSGTNPSNNFIGTTDNQPIKFKVNNLRYGLMHPNGSLYWGNDAGLNSTGYSNVALGTKALFNNTTGSNLVAIGDSALFYNGFGNVVPT
jgi:hypothetical protein